MSAQRPTPSDELRELVRQMMADWDAATDEQRQAALDTASQRAQAKLDGAR